MEVFLNILSSIGVAILLYGVYRVVRHLIQKTADKNRTLNMVFLKLVVPKKESKEEREEEQSSSSGGKDFKESIGIAAQLFESLYSIHGSKIKNHFIGQDFLSLEYAAIENQIHFYIVAPRDLKSLIEKQVTAYYPDAYVDQVEDYNIFTEGSSAVATTLQLAKDFIYPIRTYEQLNSDPLNNLTNALSKLGYDDGAAIQIMIRPKKNGWQKRGREEAKNIFSQKKKASFSWNPLSWIVGLFEILIRGEIGGQGSDTPNDATRTTPMTDEEVKALEQKNAKVGYETVVRVITSSPTEREARSHLSNIVSAFAQYNSPHANGFTLPKIQSERTVIRNFILRNMNRGFGQTVRRHYDVLSADEVASLFHLPNIRFNKAPTIAWQNFKSGAGPS